MNTKNKGKIYFSSRIRLEARIKTSMPSVKSRISCYPAIKQVATGTRITYLIGYETQADRFHVLELEKDRITMTTNSTSSPTYFMKESVLRLMSVSIALSEDYEIDLRGLLPYLTYLLSNSDILIHENRASNFNRRADIILSKRVIELLGQRNRLEKYSNELKSRLISTVSTLMLCKYGNGFDHTAISRELGVTQETIAEAINELRSRGYRFISLRNGNLEIVRA